MKYFSIFLAVIAGAVAMPFVATAQLPNDPDVEQWAYNDTDVYNAWDVTIGSPSVVVAVIDNGFDGEHPDLKNQLWTNTDEIPNNGIDDDNNGYIDDIHGWNFVDNTNDPLPNLEEASEALIESDVIHHATVVAGIIGATMNNDIAGAGISQSSLMNLKVVNSSGNGSFSAVAAAVFYAVDNGADVINVSLVSSDDSEDINTAINYAYDHDVVVVAAVGNDRMDLEFAPRYPACVDSGGEERLLGISAINEDHYLAPFSNIGGDCVDLTAPGVDIQGPRIYRPENPKLDTIYGNGWNGTSFAVPLVSGTAALIKSLHPNWSPDKIMDTILSTVQRTPPDDPDLYDAYFGAGLLQVFDAVSKAAEEVEKIDIERHILVVQPKTSDLAQRDIMTQATTVVHQPVLEGADDITAFEQDGEIFVATVKNLDREEARVTIYNSNWGVEHTWTFPSKWIEHIVVADIINDEEKEVIVVPAYGDNRIFRVYTFAGDLLREHTIDHEHHGASLALLPNKETGKYEIVVTYLTDEGVILHHFGRYFQDINRFVLPQFTDRAIVAVGDITGNGEQEYVVAGDTGEKPYVAYYTGDRLLKDFLVADEGYRGGVSIETKDYNQDTLDNVIVTQNRSSKAVSIWNLHGEQIDTWYPFGTSGSERIQVISVVD